MASICGMALKHACGPAPAPASQQQAQRQLSFYYPHFPTSGHFSRPVERNSQTRPQTEGAILKNRKFTLVADYLPLTPALWSRKRRPRPEIRQPDDKTVTLTSGAEVVRVELQAQSKSLFIRPGCNRLWVDPASERAFISMAAINGASERLEPITLAVSVCVDGQLAGPPLALHLRVAAKQTSVHQDRAPPRHRRPRSTAESSPSSASDSDPESEWLQLLPDQLLAALPDAPAPPLPAFDNDSLLHNLLLDDTALAPQAVMSPWLEAWDAAATAVLALPDFADCWLNDPSFTAAAANTSAE